jgi:uncharacterized protein YcaQ
VTLVTLEQARRIAVRAQLLDGSATRVLDTVRRLGFLQIDPIATVAPAQQLVLWSRLGRYDPAELDRRLWEEKTLFEWNAYIWPTEDFPLLHALMRQRRLGRYSGERWANEFLKTNSRFKRYVLTELGQNGPLLSRDLEDRSRDRGRERHAWYGSRNVGMMLELLHARGMLAIVGRRGGQRLWDLAERWYPETEAVRLGDAQRLLAEKRFRALGVRLGAKGWEAHPEGLADPLPAGVSLLSPFDRLIHDRARAEKLFGFRYRLEMYVPQAKREYGYYVLPILRGERLIGRLDPLLDRKAGVLYVKGVWAERDAPADAGSDVGDALRELAGWLAASEIRVGKKVPRAWSAELRAL